MGRILGPKKKFLGFFQNRSGVVQEVLGHCFWTEKAQMWVYIQLKRSSDDLENQDFW